MVSGQIVGAVALRPCAESDAKTLFDLRNNPELIALSTRKVSVTWDEHVAWLRNCLSAPQKHRIFLLEVQSLGTVGMIRFDRDNEATARISVMLDPSQTGKGIGTASLIKAIREIRTLWPTLGAVDANVIAGNKRAERAFEKAGFAQSRENPLPGHILFRLSYANSGKEPHAQ